jgi:hypothetical protein
LIQARVLFACMARPGAGGVAARLRHRLARALRLGLLGLLLSTGLAATCLAQSDAETLEYRIKAAFICKFAVYVQWPSQVFARPDSPIVIGVIARDAVVDELTRTAATLSVDGRALVVRRLHAGDAVADVHLVYVANSEERHLAEVLAAAKGRPVLVVTESHNAVAAGSMINFVVVDDKVRFDISPHAAELSSLRISARLLSVARMLIAKTS